MKYLSQNQSFVIAIFLFMAPVFSQHNLQEILDIALKNSEDLEIIDQSYEAGKQEINTFKASVYPQIHFSMGGAYINNSLAGMGAFSKMFEMLGQVIATNNTGGTTGSTGSSASFNRYSGMEYSMVAALQQPVFTFGRLGVVHRMAKTQTKLLGEQKELRREQFLVGVVQSYNSAVLALVEKKVADNTLQSASKFYSTVEIDYQAGAAPKITWLQAKSLLAQSSASSKMAGARYDVMVNNLKNTIGLEAQDSLSLVTGDDMYPENLYYTQETENSATTRLTLMKEMDLKLAVDMSKYERSRLFPTISLDGQLVNQLTAISDPELMKTDQKPYDLFNYDYFNYKIGLNLNWTLFDGFRTSSSYKRAWALKKIEERNLSKMKKQDAVRLTEAKKMVRAHKEVLEAAVISKEAAGLAFEQAKTDLEGGAISISQYIDIEKQYKQSQLLYYQAKASELFAHISLKLSMGQAVFK
ncbi:MAG: TolC family protein [Fibrobacteria bacterium]|nr:TolC family protein [Fibrobacteria bacterium]